MIISIEGNIGAGKSSLLRILKERNKTWSTHLEPIERWQSIGKKRSNLLKDFYINPAAKALALQTWITLTKFEQIQMTKAEDINIIERSINTDRDIFAITNMERGILGEQEFCVYDKLFETLTKNFEVEPDATIYIKSSPRRAIYNIGKRNREEEKEIPLGYIDTLNVKHDEFIAKLKSPVLVIDTAIEDIYHHETLQRVEDFINNLANNV